MQKFIISKSHKKILTDHASKEEPNESCAILYGESDEEFWKTKEIWLTENIDSSPIEFTLSAEQTMEMYQKEEELNLKIIGIFHSHPNGEAYPSSTDKKFMKNNPYVWTIYSGISKDFKAYVLKPDITEIQIQN